MIYLFTSGSYDDYTVTDILSGPDEFVINDTVRNDFVKFLRCPVEGRIIKYNVYDKSAPSNKREKSMVIKYCIFYDTDDDGKTIEIPIEYEHIITHLYTKFIAWLIRDRGFRKLSYKEIQI